MYMTVEEVSKVIKASKNYTYKLIKSGVIPSIKLNGKILVNKDSLEETLKELEVNKKEA